MYRLPTEAEWEYACRAGTTAPYHSGSYWSLGGYAWFNNNSDNQTHPVGQKKPNAWGLYDMHGNVFEWCMDWFTRYHANSPVHDPQGPPSGSARVRRGGCFSHGNGSARSASRANLQPKSRDSHIGFRVVLVFVQ